MPQLMPLNWLISFMVVVLLIIMMVMVYFLSFVVDEVAIEQKDMKSKMYWQW